MALLPSICLSPPSVCIREIFARVLTAACLLFELIRLNSAKRRDALTLNSANERANK